ncbi:MAG TPA: MBL fold metallo-hydrolase [Planctomycetota bacterium]|nr:MBL fold metallo-hydrolase [Planctomycetota bacterium]
MKKLCLLVTLALSLSLCAADQNKSLSIYWLDTEGGAATLIVTPAGESVLIDTGNPGNRDAQRIHKTATETAGLKHIDHLITTHYHIDHFGGAAELAALMPIKTVWDNGTFEGQTEKPSKNYQLFPSEKRAVLNPGDEIPLKAAEGAAPLKLRCIGTRKQFIAAPEGAEKFAGEAPKQKAPDLSDNANSIVMLLSFGEFRFFCAGDLTWNIEEKLVNPVNLVGTVDIYQATHHGLDISNNPVVVKALQPTVVAMMNGTSKGCGPESFATFKSVPSIQALYQIHKNLRKDGDTVNTDEALIANMEAKCEAHFIACSVAPDGSTYTMKIPAKKHEKSFATKAKRK